MRQRADHTESDSRCVPSGPAAHGDQLVLALWTHHVQRTVVFHRLVSGAPTDLLFHVTANGHGPHENSPPHRADIPHDWLHLRTFASPDRLLLLSSLEHSEVVSRGVQVRGDLRVVRVALSDGMEGVDVVRGDGLRVAHGIALFLPRLMGGGEGSHSVPKGN